MDREEGGQGTRLQALLARAGLASRRAAERLILDGRVTVNGVVVTELGTRAGEGDLVALDGKPVAPEERKRYIVLNKPAGYLASMSDPEERQLAIDLLKPAIPERVYNVGRLDQWTSGLLVFTNDGEFASLLGHPSGGIPKEYEVVADGELPDEFFEAFVRGVQVEGVRYRARSAKRSGPDSGRVVLIEGKNREIRRVLERFGRRARSLRRVRIGPVSIAGLAEGEYRELNPEEIAALRAAALRGSGQEGPGSRS